jgi:Uri superfamily endonuclease
MKGIYALVILVSSRFVTSVGNLREMEFDEGLYVYVGSAQTSLESRIARHLGKVKRRFWHIDYLLDSKGVSVVKVFQKKGPRSEECKLAEEFGRIGQAIRGFGSSDCKCQSHLFKVRDYEFLKEWMHELVP